MADSDPHAGNVYDSLTETSDDQRWAYGTGFADPLAGIDDGVPSGVGRGDLAAYCLMLGDDALVMSHRLQEWVARAPELEEETALANIGLDLLGQARPLYARVGQVDGTGRGEDAYAFDRDGDEFRNVRLAEIVDGDFAGLMARLLVFSAWRLALLSELVVSRDPLLAAVAAKGVKELAYHRDYAAEWVIRLGDGTETSRRRLDAGLDDIDPLTAELFAADEVEVRLAAAGVGVDPSGLRAAVDEVLDAVLDAATMTRRLRTRETGDAGNPGRRGEHTDALAPLLEELQSVHRALPGATW